MIVWGVLNTVGSKTICVRPVIGVGLVDAVPQVARVAGTDPRIPQAVDREGGERPLTSDPVVLVRAKCDRRVSPPTEAVTV